ncbi:hypothetical protein N431DRAFT_320565 [Stipitochalara longipes BDJ]|nr:hypothetical protein N431DRAFT_320565 [Stipitochalara longipes BDJ]
MTTSKPRVQLIPWDPASPEHVERLVQQRITCGWDSEAVPSWIEKQVSAVFNLSWLVLDDTDPSSTTLLAQHTSTYPQESVPLLDSALAYGGKPRTPPSPQRSFIPIGHICLGQVTVDYVPPAPPGYKPEEAAGSGWYWISNFYVSRVLQGSGLGRAAMDTVESIAISEPLNARVLGLNAISKVDEGREAKYEALGLTIPLFSNQEWYERRGYRAYSYTEKAFSKTDKTGKSWYWDAVCLKKEI